VADVACNDTEAEFESGGKPRAASAFLQFGALDTVRQFHDDHYGKTDLGFSVARFELFEDLSDGVALPLSSDDHAGVED
jgi:hypothetical protein